MKPETIELFEKRVLPALRSGEYRQNQFGLYAGGRYCVLGVIANEWMLEHDEPIWVMPNPPHSIAGIRHESGDIAKTYTANLSISMSESLGLTPFVKFRNPLSLGEGIVAESLGELNDYGIDFLEIADTIESLMYEDGFAPYSMGDLTREEVLG